MPRGRQPFADRQLSEAQFEIDALVIARAGRAFAVNKTFARRTGREIERAHSEQRFCDDEMRVAQRKFGQMDRAQRRVREVVLEIAAVGCDDEAAMKKSALLPGELSGDFRRIGPDTL